MRLFNPTLLLFLGLLLVVSGLLLFYVDMKMREQNHKIKAIADLATTIAQSINGGQVKHAEVVKENSKEMHNKPRENMELIQVSDDDDDDDSSSSEDDDSSSSDDDDDSSSSDDGEDNGELEATNKKISIKANQEEDLEIKHVFLSPEESSSGSLLEPEEVSGLGLGPGPDPGPESEPAPQETPAHLEQGLSDPLEQDDTFKIVLSSELDYKKMTITKLRQIVTEKGLISSTEASKLKKPDLLKLLEAE